MHGSEFTAAHTLLLIAGCVRHAYLCVPECARLRDEPVTLCDCLRSVLSPVPKVCEKEMKTKAFSKEGLGQSAKLDPRERARSEIRDWLNATVDTLNLQASHLQIP